MGEREIQTYRIARLAAMVEREGGKARAGRKLGYRDGAFIGQMLRGERPITEKTVMAVHALSGYSGWMDQSSHANTAPGSDSPPDVESTPAEDLVASITRYMDRLDDSLKPSAMDSITKFLSGSIARDEFVSTLDRLERASRFLEMDAGKSPKMPAPETSDFAQPIPAFLKKAHTS